MLYLFNRQQILIFLWVCPFGVKLPLCFQLKYYFDWLKIGSHDLSWMFEFDLTQTLESKFKYWHQFISGCHDLVFGYRRKIVHLMQMWIPWNLSTWLQNCFVWKRSQLRRSSSRYQTLLAREIKTSPKHGESDIPASSNLVIFFSLIAPSGPKMITA